MRSERLLIQKKLQAEYPMGEYLRIWGPLRHATWIEMLQDPAAKRELQDLNPDRQAAALVACVERHAELRKIVEREADDERWHVARQIWSVHHTSHPRIKSQEWHAIFEKLVALLAPIGKRGSSGDFYIVDDEVQECTHKIEWMTIATFTPQVATSMQRILRGGFLRGWRNPWALLVHLSFDTPPLKWQNHAVLLWPKDIEERWDKALLHRHVGGQFKW